jgi:hypothetical protein
VKDNGTGANRMLDMNSAAEVKMDGSRDDRNSINTQNETAPPPPLAKIILMFTLVEGHMIACGGALSCMVNQRRVIIIICGQSCSK